MNRSIILNAGLAIALLVTLRIAFSASALAREPIVDDSVVFAEQDGLIAVEAEHFFKQTATVARAFYLTRADLTPSVEPDGDPNHVAGASGGAYLEILPDTRRTHADKLIDGTNFSPQPGKLAILHYRVHFSTPGKYYVWVRAFSTGGEVNGLHVGLDGEWPASGQRLQWCVGRQSWHWESKQRTEQVHCGEPLKIYLDIPTAGEHTIMFSMREDGFEMDKWLMTKNRDFVRPTGHGPEICMHQGTPPKPFALVAERQDFPAHWGSPPPIQTRDIRVLPGGFGKGSSTLAAWIQRHLDADAGGETTEASLAKTSLLMTARSFAAGNSVGYYLDRNGKWLAVNPDQRQKGMAARKFPFPTGTYHVTLQAVGESDGKSTYTVSMDGKKLGGFTCPLSQEMYAEGPAYSKTWHDLQITEGTMIAVVSQIDSRGGQEFSRARWAALAFAPADELTRQVAAPFLAEQVAQRQASRAAARPLPTTSPTTPVSNQPLVEPRQEDGDGSITIAGQRQVWHKLTLNLNGPYAHEHDNVPNPFTDYSLQVEWRHRDGTSYTVPGYFAADGEAANSSAQSGTQWRAHFAPDRTGDWTYRVAFRYGQQAALDPGSAAQPLPPYDGKSGSLQVSASDKQGRDLRAHGRLQYVGKHYLQFAGSKQYFLKVGADAPETLLAYADFDNTVAGKPKRVPLKTWSPHISDWKDGDPTWKDGKGKGLIGAINYLSGKGCNAFSFITYNAGGDGDNVWPFVDRDDKLHYDCSKLDQWATVFEHGTAKGMYLHFKMQETENDDHRTGHSGSGNVPESLDGGNLGVQRKLYCRELIARFGHNLALNWNLSEESTQTTGQQQAMINYIASVDAYDHNIVVHTFPGQQDQVYSRLLGSQSKLTGVSLQNSSLKTTHAHTVKWVKASAKAGKPWIVAFDESGSAAHGQCPDLGYRGFDGHDRTGKMIYTQHEVRKQTLWGHLMGGGAGCEYYFGYQFAENDLLCEDWRSRDQSWDYCRIAIGFFHDHKIPFWEMENRDELVGNPEHDTSKFCFAKPDDMYLVYIPNGGQQTSLDLTGAEGEYNVHWFNPRTGGQLSTGSVATLAGGKQVCLGRPPEDEQQDWVALVRKRCGAAGQVCDGEKIESIGQPLARHEAALVACFLDENRHDRWPSSQPR